VCHALMHLPDDLVEEEQADDAQACLTPRRAQASRRQPVGRAGCHEEQILQADGESADGPERLFQQPREPSVEWRLARTVEDLQALREYQLLGLVNLDCRGETKPQ